MTLLHPYARRFAEALLSQFPAWSQYAQIGCPDHGANHLFVTVPSPSGPALLICAGDEDAEVWWDRWHFHAEDLEQENGMATGWPVTLRELEDIIADRIEIAVHMKGDEWKGSVSCHVEADADNAWLNFINERGDFDRCYSVSWTGRTNRSWSAAPSKS
jgi:hypothetical protein